MIVERACVFLCVCDVCVCVFVYVVCVCVRTLMRARRRTRRRRVINFHVFFQDSHRCALNWLLGWTVVPGTSPQVAPGALPTHIRPLQHQASLHKNQVNTNVLNSPTAMGENKRLILNYLSVPQCYGLNCVLRKFIC